MAQSLFFFFFFFFFIGSSHFKWSLVEIVLPFTHAKKIDLRPSSFFYSFNYGFFRVIERYFRVKYEFIDIAMVFLKIFLNKSKFKMSFEIPKLEF